MEYVLLYGFSFLFAFADIFHKKNILSKDSCLLKRSFFVFSFCLFFYVSAFRYKTGYDWVSYENYFINSLKDPFNGHLEPGYILLNIIFRCITDDFYVLQFFIALFAGICFYKFVHIYSPYPLFSVCVYLCFMYPILNMGFLRQLIAVSFFLIALDNYIKGEKKISVLIIIAGITFHYSAATYFMLFFINTKKYNRLFPMLILGVFTLLFSNYTLFRQVGLKIIDLPLIPYRIKWMLSAYFSLSNMTSKMGYFGLGWLAKRLIVWFVLFFRKPRTEIEILFYKIVIIGLVFETCGLTVIVLARLSYSFLMLEFIILAYIISMMRQRKNSFFFYNFGVLLLLFYLIQGPVNWFVLRNDDEARRYNPYYSVFFKPAFSERIEWQISRYNNP